MVPVFAYPNLDLTYILDTDASAVGLGMVLSQSKADKKG